jgi:acyl-CoA thioester hydrolase
VPKLLFESDRTVYSTTIEVLVSHLNYGNHLGYDSLLSILQDARMRWLNANKMREMSLEGSLGYVISEVVVNYKGEGFFGDILNVSLYPGQHGRKTFSLKYQVTNPAKDMTIALAETTHVGFDFERRTIASLPDSFLKIIRGKQTSPEKESNPAI